MVAQSLLANPPPSHPIPFSLSRSLMVAAGAVGDSTPAGPGAELGVKAGVEDLQALHVGHNLLDLQGAEDVVRHDGLMGGGHGRVKRVR